MKSVFKVFAKLANQYDKRVIENAKKHISYAEKGFVIEPAHCEGPELVESVSPEEAKAVIQSYRGRMAKSLRRIRQRSRHYQLV